MNKSYIVIGASAAGVSAVRTLRQLDPYARIICLTDEIEVPYNKCFLADYLSGEKTQEQVTIFTQEQADEKKITLLRGKKVVKLVPVEKKIILHDGQEIFYDALFIATGTSPVIPDIPGITAQGVFNFHGMAHAQELLRYVEYRKPCKALVIGAGLSGLECADALTNYGINVTIVERSDHILGRLLDQPGACYLEQKIVSAGLNLYTQETVVEISTKDGHVSGACLSSNLLVPADMIVCALGARPNSSFARDAHIALQDSWIRVDETMQTSVSGIYAGGDVVVVKDQISGNLVPSCTWPDAVQQGMVAAYNMTGTSKKYPGVLVVTSSAFFGVKFASCGPIAYQHGYEKIATDTLTQEYKSFLIKNNLLYGFLIIAPTLSIGSYRRAILTRQQITGSQLLYGAF